MKNPTDQQCEHGYFKMCSFGSVVWRSEILYFLLAVFYYIIAAMTVIADGLLMYKLLKKKEKRRIDMLLTILSMSDICAGLVSVPVTSLPFFITDFEILCKLCPSLTFFFFLIFFFSLSPNGNKKSHASKVCYNECFIIAFLLLKDILSVIFVSLYLNVLGFSNKLRQFTFLLIESF